MIRTHFAIALAALALSTGAFAAKPGEWDNAPSAQARKTAVFVARCMVEARPVEVGAALDAPFASAEANGVIVPLTAPCLDKLLKPLMMTRPSQLMLPQLLLRGLIYEVMYARKFGKASPPASFGVTAAAYPTVAATASGTLAHDYPALMRIGDCAVRAAPAEARALILSEVASKREEEALAAFQPAWTGCLTGRRQVTFSIEMIRATVAEPLYRLTEADQHAPISGSR